MMPECRVAGGSFSHWLPHPRDVPRTDRQRVLLETQREATGSCLTDLVASAGLPAVEPSRRASGARKWPAGYTGSVTHKGTTVLAAIAPPDQMMSIGIDVERLEAQDVPPIHGLDAAEQPWPLADSGARTILFSVKEAAYKALHPILGGPLHFADVAVFWLAPDPVRRRGLARACGVTLDVRCSIAVASWVLSVALWPDDNAQSRANP